MVRGWIDESFHLDPETGMSNDISATAMFSVMEYVGKTLADRQANPRDDMFTDLVNMEITEEDGVPRRLTLEQAVNFARAHRQRRHGDGGPHARVGGLGARQQPGPAGRAGGRRQPDPQRRRRGPALRGAVAGAEPLVHRGRRGARRHHPGPLEGRDDHRAQPAGTSGPTRTPTASTSTGSSTTTCPSATASTSAWAPRWPGPRGGSPSRRPSSASPNGRSTWPGRSRSTRARSGATPSCRSASDLVPGASGARLGPGLRYTVLSHPALVAQRTRASDYGSEGWGFESLRARKKVQFRAFSIEIA